MASEPTRRGEVRRRAILTAALAVISREGVGATTHRAVAAESGVPLGTVTYHYGSIDVLLESALRWFVEEETERLRAVAEELTAARVVPDDVVAAVVGELATEPHRSALPQFELYLEAARRPSLRVTARECLAAYGAVAEAALRAAGSPRAGEGAMLFVALIDGLALHQMASGREEHIQLVRSALRELFIPFAMDAGERERWEERLRGAEREVAENGV
jgi:TetR/AcrR family transcriptional regulator, regulator of biofilm formation and stress response